MTRARLGRYSLWQLRDYFLERGLPLLVVCALLGWITWSATAGLRYRLGPDGLEAIGVAIWRDFVPQVALFGTILALNGIVATDLRQGYFRLIFARPVSAPAYYAQAFCVNGLALGVVTFLCFQLLALALGVPAPVWPVAYVLLHYVALGGIIFLASSASVAWLGRFDWLAASTLWFGGMVTHELAEHGQRWARVLAPVLPPSWRTDDVFQALLGGAPPPTAALAYLLGYGAVCFLLGLIVLRHRPLAA